MYIHNFVAIMSTFRTKARLAGAMDTLVGNAMIYKHLVIPHWDGWRIHQNIIYTKMERNTINTKLLVPKICSIPLQSETCNNITSLGVSHVLSILTFLRMCVNLQAAQYMTYRNNHLPLETVVLIRRRDNAHVSSSFTLIMETRIYLSTFWCRYYMLSALDVANSEQR